MGNTVDPSGLPRWFLLVVLAFGIAGALTHGYLNAGYNIFGTFVPTMDVAGGIFIFGAAMGIIAYMTWI